MKRLELGSCLHLSLSYSLTSSSASIVLLYNLNLILLVVVTVVFVNLDRRLRDFMLALEVGIEIAAIKNFEAENF